MRLPEIRRKLYCITNLSIQDNYRNYKIQLYEPPHWEGLMDLYIILM